MGFLFLGICCKDHNDFASKMPSVLPIKPKNAPTFTRNRVVKKRQVLNVALTIFNRGVSSHDQNDAIYRKSPCWCTDR